LIQKLIDQQAFRRGGCLFPALAVGAAVALAVTAPMSGKLAAEVAFLVAFAVIGWLAARVRVRVFFEPDERALRVVHTRGPLGATIEVFPLAHVRDVLLEEKTLLDGGNYDYSHYSRRSEPCTMVFVLDSGRRVPIVYYARKRNAEPHLAAIRRLL
jgi:hypothetical protein